MHFLKTAATQPPGKVFSVYGVGYHKISHFLLILICWPTLLHFSSFSYLKLAHLSVLPLLPLFKYSLQYEFMHVNRASNKGKNAKKKYKKRNEEMKFCKLVTFKWWILCALKKYLIFLLHIFMFFFKHSFF